MARSRGLGDVYKRQGWAELTAQEKEDAIVHELCHLYTTPLRAAVYESVDMVVDEAHRAAFKTHIDGAMEFCTENLAWTLQEHEKETMANRVDAVPTSALDRINKGIRSRTKQV
jgi:hypothetical protein